MSYLWLVIRNSLETVYSLKYHPDIKSVKWLSFKAKVFQCHNILEIYTKSTLLCSLSTPLLNDLNFISVVQLLPKLVCQAVLFILSLILSHEKQVRECDHLCLRGSKNGYHVKDSKYALLIGCVTFLSCIGFVRCSCYAHGIISL